MPGIKITRKNLLRTIALVVRWPPRQQASSLLNQPGNSLDPGHQNNEKKLIKNDCFGADPRTCIPHFVGQFPMLLFFTFVQDNR